MQINGNFISGEKVRDRVFGGFCTCGGIMFQKLWFDADGKSILVSECEKCWRNEAMTFNKNRFISREEIEVIDRREFKDMLKNFLSTSEYDALQSKLRDEEYNYNAFSRAKKKIEEIGLTLEDVISYI
jgi:hypothetical protein